MLSRKKILLGICGSIAAYKSAYLCRGLVKEGADVKVVMTDDATSFISPLTLSTLSRNPVLSSLTRDEQWNNHIELGLWADVFIVAPATAQTLAKMALGLCDNLLTASYLSARCPTMVAPAMDVDMWLHPSTQRNINQLQKDGVQVISVAEGELASGLQGPGRMAEPGDIVERARLFFKKKSDLEGVRVLVTAGPTYEDIDPVRYIGNRSSGKMGIAISEALIQRGAQVDIILGPTSLRPKPNGQLLCHHVRSAVDMALKAKELWKVANYAVLAAAVADFRPREVAKQKIKKTTDLMHVFLEPTEDIALTLAQTKNKDQAIVGFALESEHGFENAVRKLKKKSFDLIVLNSLEDEGAGFQYDTNKVTFITADGEKKTFPLKQKTEVASDIVDQIVLMHNTNKKK